MSTTEIVTPPDVANHAAESNDRPSAEETVADATNVMASQADAPVVKGVDNATPAEAPAESRQEGSTQEESTKSNEQTPPKLNPGATEFISRSSSTGPGLEGIASQKPNTLTQSRHAGVTGGRVQSRRGRQSTPNSRPPFANPSNDSSSANANPVILADPVAVQEGTDVAGMTGFRAPRAAREPRPPRGYVPPAPERKTRLTADELEEKMAKMRLLNERTQAEQEARNADAQAYESQVSAERERAIKERERRKAEAEAKSKRTQAVQSNIDQQREQYRLRKLKLLESQGGLDLPDDRAADDVKDSYRSFGRDSRPQEREGRAGYGGYGYRGGHMGARGGYSGGRQLYDNGENGERRNQEPRGYQGGSGRGDFRGRGRGQAGPARGGRQAGSQASGAVKPPKAVVPDTQDEGAFPTLGDGKTTKVEEVKQESTKAETQAEAKTAEVTSESQA